jgi:glycosyltransferase involved in cell wall biosynthesis
VFENRRKVLIGSLNRANRGAVVTVTSAFIEGLRAEYEFIPHYSCRSVGNESTSDLNVVNVYYLLKHLALWIYELLRYRPDIAHYPITSYWNMEKSLIFLCVAKALGSKTVAHLHGGAFKVFWRELKGWRFRLAVRLLSYVDQVVVLSKEWQYFVEGEMPVKRVSVVNNPIDKAFEVVATRTARSVAKRVLFVGSLGKNKGVYDIVRCVGRMKVAGWKEFMVQLVGEEDRMGDLERIKALIRKEKVAEFFEFLGPLYGRGKIEVFREADVFVLPSYYENFPLVIIEAACAGLPIITTKVGALPEFFEHKRSVVFVEAGDVDSLAKSLAELLSNYSLRVSLGKGARAVFEQRLQRDRIMKQLEGVYERVLR